MSSPDLIQKLRRLRNLQRQFFGSHNRDLLGQIRPLEQELLPTLEKLHKSKKADKAIPPALLQVALQMMQHQQAWIAAKTHMLRLASIDADAEAQERAEDKASELERKCKTLELQTDKAIADFLSPPLPGLS